MKSLISKLSFVFLFFLSGEAIAQNLAFGDMLQVERQYVHSTANGKAYQLLISLPTNYSPADTTRYPVLYFLDGFYEMVLKIRTRNFFNFVSNGQTFNSKTKVHR